jgi:hypothetical protein
LPHHLGQEAALQRLILIGFAHPYHFRSEHAKRLRVEFPLPALHSAQHGHAVDVAVVEHLDDSAFSSLNRKSASSRISVPRKASRIWKIGETVLAPLAKNGL